jgi:thiamine kinase-like enzyme
MDEATTERLVAAIERVPVLGDAGVPERLGGLTNLNVKIGPYVVRLPGEGTSEYIDRANEAVAARSAADSGVNVELIHFDPTDGLMVTRFLDGAVTMSGERFKADRGAVERAGVALHRLHTAAAPFATDFVLFPMIDEYKALLAAKGATLPDGYDEVQDLAVRARRALEANPMPLVPCHCDPLCENFLDTGDRMFVIDYEYAGNNDPMWDLGDLSVEGGFDTAQDMALLRAYFGGEPPPEQAARMVIHKAMCDLLWTLWGVIQHVNGNPVDDFWSYAVGRFERCQRLMSSERFATAVATLTTA